MKESPTKEEFRYMVNIDPIMISAVDLRVVEVLGMLPHPYGSIIADPKSVTVLCIEVQQQILTNTPSGCLSAGQGEDDRN